MDKLKSDILSMGYRQRATGVYMKPVAFAVLTIEVKEEIRISLWFKSNTWEEGDPDTDYCKNGMCIWSSEVLKWKNSHHGALAEQIKEFEREHLFSTGDWNSEFNFLTIEDELNFVL